MATKKTPKPTLTIVAAYRRLNDILEEYRSQVNDTAGTVDALDKLSKEAKDAGLPLNISITEEDLDETGINPTYQSSDNSYEPEPSEEEESY